MEIIIVIMVCGYIFFLVKEYREPTMEVSGFTMRSWVHTMVFLLILGFIVRFLSSCLY